MTVQTRPEPADAAGLFFPLTFFFLAGADARVNTNSSSELNLLSKA